MKAINEMTSREAMSLPTFYKSGLLENQESYFQDFVKYDRETLFSMIDNNNINERYVIATMLGLIGDPRINVYDPIMIEIPSDDVLIGSSHEEVSEAYERYKNYGVKKEWIEKEFPKHSVYINSFKIAKYPVTNYEYLVFLKDTNHEGIPSSWPFGIYDNFKANHPVYGIMPNSADEYAKWLNQKTKRKFRLPSEYEWEYAAGGREHLEFPWGAEFSNELANTLESKIYTTTPIGLYIKGSSPFGCMDMAGNVEEYVSNDYFVYPGGNNIVDDLNINNHYRIARGGSFTRHSDLARCKRRHGFHNNNIYAIGFRLAETI